LSVNRSRNQPEVAVKRPASVASCAQRNVAVNGADGWVAADDRQSSDGD
jgi:hypothetical protein